MYSNIALMELVHARDYSVTFFVLCSIKVIGEAFGWSEKSRTLHWSLSPCPPTPLWMISLIIHGEAVHG